MITTQKPLIVNFKPLVHPNIDTLTHRYGLFHHHERNIENYFFFHNFIFHK